MAESSDQEKSTASPQYIRDIFSLNEHPLRRVFQLAVVVRALRPGVQLKHVKCTSVT
jgi:hypothetical protein